MTNGPKLERETLAERLATQLRQQILAGRLETGARVPAERELCEAFGVGRTTVREALHALVAGGFLRRTGNQLIVTDVRRLPDHEVDYAALAARLSAADLFDVRRTIEAKAVELAARHWTDDDIERLTALVADMRAAPDQAAYQRADVAFHTAVVAVGRNPVLVEIYESSKNLFFKLPGFWRVFAADRDEPARPITGWEGHQRIVDAVARRDVPGAVATSDELLARVERTLVQRMARAAEAATPLTILHPETRSH